MVNTVEEEEEETGARMIDEVSSIGSWVDDVEGEEEERRSRAFSQTSSSSDQVCLSSSSC